MKTKLHILAVCCLLLISFSPTFAAFDAVQNSICKIWVNCGCGTYSTEGTIQFCQEGWGFCFNGSDCEPKTPVDCAVLCAWEPVL